MSSHTRALNPCNVLLERVGEESKQEVAGGEEAGTGRGRLSAWFVVGNVVEMTDICKKDSRKTWEMTEEKSKNFLIYN